MGGGLSYFQFLSIHFWACKQNKIAFMIAHAKWTESTSIQILGSQSIWFCDISEMIAITYFQDASKAGQTNTRFFRMTSTMNHSQQNTS